VLPWTYPNHVAFYSGGQAQDEGIELAPTKWQEISEVNIQDPHLNWYRYDEKRERILIPRAHLPGARP
jgi:hypothetical protein